MTEKKNPAAVALGRKGGKAGTGASQRRGDPDYYRKLVEKRWAKQKKPAPDKPTP